MVIPTAVSLAFGLRLRQLSLVFVPCLYNVLGDFVGFKKAKEIQQNQFQLVNH